MDRYDPAGNPSHLLARLSVLEILDSQFEATEKALQEFSFENNLNPLQSADDDLMDLAAVDYLSDMSSPEVVLQLFKMQLVEIAAILMSSYVDRLTMRYMI